MPGECRIAINNRKSWCPDVTRRIHFKILSGVIAPHTENFRAQVEPTTGCGPIDIGKPAAHNMAASP